MIHLFICFCFCLCVCEGQRTTCSCSSLLPPCWSWGLNSGHQAWLQTPLPAKPSWPPAVLSHLSPSLLPRTADLTHNGPGTGCGFPVCCLSCVSLAGGHKTAPQPSHGGVLGSHPPWPLCTGMQTGCGRGFKQSGWLFEVSAHGAGSSRK